MNHKEIGLCEEELKNEVWKSIPFYENIYEASNLGRIRTSANKTTYTKRHGIRHWEQRILKYKSKNDLTGYRVSLWKDGKTKDYLVARLVASAFIENNLFNRKMTVNHINDNRFDNRIDNLEWCSLKENIQKGFKTGAYKKNQKKVSLINKVTNEKKDFDSLSSASRFLNHCNGYISSLIKRGKTEISNYIIKIASL